VVRLRVHDGIRHADLRPYGADASPVKGSNAPNGTAAS